MSDKPESNEQQRDPEAKKNRPTPSRRQQEQARRRPLVPEDRKTAKAEARAEMRRERNYIRERMMEGDERYLPARDVGPQRRYIRDYVDARYSFGELLIPIALVILLVSLFIQNAQVQAYSTYVIYVLLGLVVLDGFIIHFTLKKKMSDKFGAENLQRGNTFYAIMRSIQLRMLRTPRALVGRREYPN